MVDKDDWDHLVVGRGSADQLAGVVSQIISSKIMLELKSEGALKGVIIRYLAIKYYNFELTL